MPNKKAIIFGAGGQDGFYLTQLLQQSAVEVFPVSRKGSFIIGDVGDYAFVTNLVKTTEPDYIFHLAADSTTAHDAWLNNHTTICNGSLYILEAVKKYAPAAKVFLSGSGLQFVNNDLPIKETDPFVASSPYAVSRIQSVYAARYYRSLGIRAYVGYFFNHDSPRRSERHMTMKIAQAVLRIAAGSDEMITIGDLDARKEWGFAGDIVKAVWQLVNQDQVLEAAIGTGIAHSLAEWVNLCFARIDRAPEPYLQSNDHYKSPYQVLVSDPTTIFSLGWKPEVDLNSLANLMMQPSNAQ